MNQLNDFPIDVSVYERLNTSGFKLLREKLNLTQSEMGEILGVSIQRISHIELVKSPVPIKHYPKLIELKNRIV